VKRTLLLGKESKDVELLHQDGVTTLVWEGQSHPIDILEMEPGCYSILLAGRSVEVRLDAARSPDPEAHAYRAMLYDGAYEFALVDPRRALLAAAGEDGAGSAAGAAEKIREKQRSVEMIRILAPFPAFGGTSPAFCVPVEKPSRPRGQKTTASHAVGGPPCPSRSPLR